MTGFNEWTSVHHHSVCPSALHFEKTPLDVLYVSTNRTIPIGFYEWTSFHITTLYTRFAFVLWRTRLPSTR
nr:MAG TPA: hypothetical protein [Caudoviricetes sp.]